MDSSSRYQASNPKGPYERPKVKITLPDPTPADPPTEPVDPELPGGDIKVPVVPPISEQPVEPVQPQDVCVKRVWMYTVTRTVAYDYDPWLNLSFIGKIEYTRKVFYTVWEERVRQYVTVCTVSGIHDAGKDSEKVAVERGFFVERKGLNWYGSLDGYAQERTVTEINGEQLSQMDPRRKMYWTKSDSETKVKYLVELADGFHSFDTKEQADAALRNYNNELMSQGQFGQTEVDIGAYDPSFGGVGTTNGQDEAPDGDQGYLEGSALFTVKSEKQTVYTFSPAGKPFTGSVVGVLVGSKTVLYEGQQYNGTVLSKWLPDANLDPNSTYLIKDIYVGNKSDAGTISRDYYVSNSQRIPGWTAKTTGVTTNINVIVQSV